MAPDSKIWTGTLTANDLKNIGDGDKNIIIQAKDLTDHQLDGNPMTISKVNPDTSLKENYEDENSTDTHRGGKDTMHQFTIDTTPPTITFSGAENGKTYLECKESLTVNYSVTDDKDPEPQITYASHRSGEVFKRAGNYTVKVEAKDDAGNEATMTLSFRILPDTTPPTITISGARNRETYLMPVSFIVTYTVTDNQDPHPQITYPLPNQPYPSGTVFDSKGSYTVLVKAEDCAGNKATETLMFTIDRWPPPDDSYSISDGTPSPIISDPFAKIGVLNRGMIGSLCPILTNLKESYAVIDLPIEQAGLQKYPLIIIPSGGLNGLENSRSFKDSLQQYVQNGGVILSFTQERGYLFDVLPGDWQGTGYLEEEGCLTYAGGIENQHVIFSGQDSVYIDANVDGYFTGWPKDGKVLVRRTKNAMPFLIEYPVGEGIILASTLYSDYGYLSGQLNPDEKRLIRDIVSWGKDVDTLINAYNAGNLVGETVTILNNSSVDAYLVTYNFYDPDKNLVYTYEEPIAGALPPGEYAEGSLTYQLPVTNCPLGIYWIKYLLKDALGNPIQEEVPTSRFAVKKEIGTVDISKDVNVVVKTTQSFYPIGSTGTFQIVVYNDKSEDIPVRVRYGTSFHDPVYSPYGDKYFEKVIPANGSEIFTVDVANLNRGDYFSAGVFDQSNRNLAFAQERFYVFYPSIKATISTDKITYLPEEGGRITYNLVNVKKTDYEVTANIRILDKVGNKILEDSKTLLLSSGKTVTDYIAFTAPAKGGPYVVQIEALSFGSQLGSASCYFEVITGDSLTITSHYPETWAIGGNNTISFNVKNISQSPLPLGTIKSTLYDPDEEIVWTEEKQFSDLPAGETTTVDFVIPLTEGKFGTYRLRCVFSYLENSYKYYADFSNEVVFNLSFDKNSYKMREDMLLNLDITNNGVFEQDITVEIEIPTFGYTDTRNVHLSRTAAVPYIIVVPPTISSGTHALNVSLNLANQLVKTYNFVVPPSRLILSIDKSSYNAGETGTIKVENIGGVDTTYVTEKLSIIDNKGLVIYQGSVTGTILSGEKKTLSDIQIPPQAVNGPAFLFIRGFCKSPGSVTLNEVKGLVSH